MLQEGINLRITMDSKFYSFIDYIDPQAKIRNNLTRLLKILI